ncbi:hypothetical protein BV20DRAFT_927542, partial [Pilatotrama ljubarskyi]
DDRTLVDTLASQAMLGNQSENGFKNVAYVAAATALEGSEEESGERAKTSQSCKDRFLTVRPWVLYQGYALLMIKLREQSGFGWNEDEHLVTAPDGVWEKYLEAHPAARKWKKTPFTLYDEMAALVDGTSATG